MKYLFLIVALATCSQDYSHGDRVGTIVKFSYKGLTCKTWEGEMNLGGVKDGAADVWRFTVTDTTIVSTVQETMQAGKRVKVHYSEWLVGPICNDSSYEVTKVEAVP